MIIRIIVYISHVNQLLLDARTVGVIGQKIKDARRRERNDYNNILFIFYKINTFATVAVKDIDF